MGICASSRKEAEVYGGSSAAAEPTASATLSFGPQSNKTNGRQQESHSQQYESVEEFIDDHAPEEDSENERSEDEDSDDRSDEPDEDSTSEENTDASEANFGLRDECTGLHSVIDFPPFTGIPDENDTSHRYYLAESGCHVDITRHWCLLGEIKDVSMSLRPRIAAKDKSGRSFRTHAHIKDRSSTLKLDDMKVGNTLAFMCPEMHSFMDGTVGIRQENPDTAYIFRAGLGQLVAEGDKILANPQRCYGCGAAASKKCFRCGVAIYCGKPCQLQHWHSAHKHLCTQMTVFRNLLSLDFSRKPGGNLADFCELARPARNSVSHSISACQLPRPCFCGFQHLELANSDDCPMTGFENHLDFPPAACLPQAGGGSEDKTSRQFFYDADDAPFRHWAIVAEVLAVNRDVLKATTKFGEQIQLIVNGNWDTSVVKPGHCIVGLYAVCKGTGEHGEVIVALEHQRHIHFRTKTGLRGLLNAEAHVYHLFANDSKAPGGPATPIVRPEFEGFEDLPQADGQTLKKLFARQALGGFSFCEGHPGMWDSGGLISGGGQSNTENVGRDPGDQCSQSDAGNALAKVAADLRAILVDHPQGLRGGLLPSAFEACHGRRLDPKALGFKSLRRLLVALSPDLVVNSQPPAGETGKVGSDEWVQLRLAAAPVAAEVPKPVQANEAPAFGLTRLKPNEICFTHDSIQSKFRDGRPLLDTFRQLKEGSVKVTDIPTIQVCWQPAAGYDARFWTYTGNRRLWVFRQLQELGHVQEIEVVVVDKIVPKFRMTTRDGGQAVRVRGETHA
ncbi:unnamed protein product [Polarella glacialis]|uniref:MYND-type domain-containing protein n=1 Tax=Polarella glacialis TaxID=89957 RepID=A0A813I7P2_POLGL|nr:unnamed protein product [Polarella glacialis]